MLKEIQKRYLKNNKSATFSKNLAFYQIYIFVFVGDNTNKGSNLKLKTTQ